MLTYVISLMNGEFDFGIVFEIISFGFLLIARNYILKYDEIKAKRYNMCAIASIGWILIYDIIVFLASIEEMAFIAYDYFPAM